MLAIFKTYINGSKPRIPHNVSKPYTNRRIRKMLGPHFVKIKHIKMRRIIHPFFISPEHSTK